MVKKRKDEADEDKIKCKNEVQDTDVIKSGEKDDREVEDIESTENNNACTCDSKGQVDENENMEDKCDKSDEIADLSQKLEQKEKELEENIELAQRIKAEFDNYKRRVSREKEQLYTDMAGDIISKFIPIIDNIERAVSAASDGNDSQKVLEGIEMILNQFMDVMNKEGVEEIPALNQQFDPNLHNAVMHVEDEGYEANTIVEVFQKGYMLNGKVLRYSMVKVAN